MIFSFLATASACGIENLDPPSPAMAFTAIVSGENERTRERLVHPRWKSSSKKKKENK